MVISADERNIPILAYSTTGRLSDRPSNAGIANWFGKTKEDIIFLKNNKLSPHPSAKKAWKDFRKNGGLPPKAADEDESERYKAQEELPVEPCDPNPTIIRKEPLIKTTWYQRGIYNDLAPEICLGQVDTRAPAGCVAIAMAQIERYWSYPLNYNWSLIPATGFQYTPNYEVSKLVRDAADAVITNWDCSGSGAIMNNIDDAFRSMGYSQASYSVYHNSSYQTVINEINANAPVILGSCTKDWWQSGNDCHAWICDGYIQTIYPCYASYLYFHMNWGWGGEGDGWFAFNNWQVTAYGTTYNFQYCKEMITNIRP